MGGVRGMEQLGKFYAQRAESNKSTEEAKLKDLKRAFNWNRKGSQLKSVSCMVDLAGMYRRGTAVNSADHKKALKLYKRSVEGVKLDESDKKKKDLWAAALNNLGA